MASGDVPYAGVEAASRSECARERLVTRVGSAGNRAVDGIPDNGRDGYAAPPRFYAEAAHLLIGQGYLRSDHAEMITARPR